MRLWWIIAVSIPNISISLQRCSSTVDEFVVDICCISKCIIAEIQTVGEVVVDAVKKAAEVGVQGSETGEEHDHEHEHHHSHGDELHTYIGVTLVLGFIFMLLVDQLSGGMHAHAGPGMIISYILYLSSWFLAFLLDCQFGNTFVADAENGHVAQNRNKMTATLGLVVHAAGVYNMKSNHCKKKEIFDSLHGSSYMLYFLI